MKKKLVSFPLLAVFLLSAHASARPNPDRLGICYVFVNSQLSTRGPCIVSTGYGAGAQYTSLNLNGKEYYVEYPNLKPDQPPTLNGQAALDYQRDTSFFQILKGKPLEGEDYMFCIKTKDGRTDICYATNV